MELTPAQLQTLKAAILAETDATFVALRNAGATAAMADWYNVASSFVVWKTLVSNVEIGDAMNGTEIAGLSALQMQRAQMLANYSDGYQNPSRADRRAAFDAIFSGAGGQITRAALATLWRREATRGEKLYATGTGTTNSPGTLTFEGPITNNDIVLALGT